MPKRKFDPLGRNHQTVQKPQNRSVVDACANYVLKHAKKDFMKKPSFAHVYMEAYIVIFGITEAIHMLERARR